MSDRVGSFLVVLEESASEEDARRISDALSLFRGREFRVTFGQRYRREPHPHLECAHPDGYATVWAEGIGQARAITHAHLVEAWAEVYDAADGYDWARGFPLGELAVLNPEYAP